MTSCNNPVLQAETAPWQWQTAADAMQEVVLAECASGIMGELAPGGRLQPQRKVYSWYGSLRVPNDRTGYGRDPGNYCYGVVMRLLLKKLQHEKHPHVVARSWLYASAAEMNDEHLGDMAEALLAMAWARRRRWRLSRCSQHPMAELASRTMTSSNDSELQSYATRLEHVVEAVEPLTYWSWYHMSSLELADHIAVWPTTSRRTSGLRTEEGVCIAAAIAFSSFSSTSSSDEDTCTSQEHAFVRSAPEEEKWPLHS